MSEQILKAGGSAYITGLIEEACKNGTRTATVTGNWTVETAIRLPSDFTLILDGCCLTMADGVYSNCFVNEHHGTDLGRTVKGTDRNISILGKNGAALDGGNYNGLSERTANKNGLPPIWKNNLILFTNVDGFEISGLACRNQRWWALNFIYCAHGTIRDIDFAACDLRVMPDGTLQHGLTWDDYDGILVKNADGVDLRQGCHDITVENITGFTEDDTVALTGLFGRMEATFAVAGLSSDIRNITVRNVASESFCANVRLLNQGGIKLHDIEIDGVYDTSAGTTHMEKGIYAVRIGDKTMYGARHATEEETYNISVRNVRFRGFGSAIALAGDMKNVTWENVECEDGAILLSDARDPKGRNKF